jgi:hypothetical protein
MSILARFNMGKPLNLIQRDNFQIRSYLTGPRYNKGEEWHLSSWKKAFKKKPWKNFKTLCCGFGNNREDSVARSGTYPPGPFRKT